MTWIDQTESVEQQKRPTHPLLLLPLAYPDDAFELYRDTPAW
jgi:hypothetical protein